MAGAGPIPDADDLGSIQYNMKHSERGFALIFNNQHFAKSVDERLGTQADVENLSFVLNSLLGFEVILYNDADSFVIQSTVNRYAKEVDHGNFDCFLMVVLSHGGYGGAVKCIYDGNAQVLKDHSVNLYELTGVFKKCETLKGKPKIFLIQDGGITSRKGGWANTVFPLVPSVVCVSRQFVIRNDKIELLAMGLRANVVLQTCRGAQGSKTVDISDDNTELITQIKHRIAPGPDFLYAFPTAPGCISFRNEVDGSWFVNSLCKVFKNCAHDPGIDFARILTMVSRDVSADHPPARNQNHPGAKQAPTTEASLTKLLYLTAKPPSKLFVADFSKPCVTSNKINVEIDEKDKISCLKTTSKFSTIVIKGYFCKKPVAVKQIHLSESINDKEMKIQLATLNTKLSYLTKARHLNVVHYLEMQSFTPYGSEAQRKTMHFSYQIIMEYCAGGTLTEVVKSPMLVKTVLELGKGILSGIDYLHNGCSLKQPIIHNAIHGDHLVFTGAGRGQGIIKIISVGRIAEILPDQDSYKKPVTLPFPPPEINCQWGRKTDIWAFGCVILHLVTGRVPQRESQHDVPLIPNDLCQDLQDVIRKCLTPEYEERSKAEELLAMPFFNNSLN